MLIMQLYSVLANPGSSKPLASRWNVYVYVDARNVEVGVRVISRNASFNFIMLILS